MYEFILDKSKSVCFNNMAFAYCREISMILFRNIATHDL